MRKTLFVSVFVILGLAVAVRAIPQSKNDSQEETLGAALGFVRKVNTFQVGYWSEHNRYADRDEMLAYLEQQGYSKEKLSASLPEKYELAITTSHDGQQFQLTLDPALDLNDQNVVCRKAIFSNEKGLIFVGMALGCEGAPE